MANTIMDYTIAETNLQRQHVLSTFLNPVTTRSLENISLKPFSKILDIGCGLGDTTQMLSQCFPDSTITGIDGDAALIRVAREEKKTGYPQLHFLFADALQLPFADNSFDLVFTRLCLHHIPDVVTALQEMKRVCKQGGTIFAQEPDIHATISYPESWAYQKHNEFVRQLFADALFGRKLLYYFRQLQLQHLSHHVECVIGDQNNTAKQFITMTAVAIGDKLLQKNLATKSEHAALVTELERAQHDPATIIIMAPSVAVWGTKN